ncbi:MAG: tetratricopeptide repeat protein [Magnetococcales bacterium]|nr:tetratricopeptide repeat protein [Magnetococcales bacterium]
MNRAERRRQEKLVKKNGHIETATNTVNAQNALQRAVSFHKGGQIEDAILWYRKALEYNPTDLASLLNMGAALQGRGEITEAIACYQKAITIKPDYPNAYCNLGVAYQDLGRLDEAIKTLKKAIELAPEFPDALSNLGNALFKNGDIDEAIIYCKKAIAIKPDYAEALSNLGNCLKEQDSYEEAISCLQKAIAIKPDFAEAYSNLGVALFEQGRDDEAINSYKKAISIKPNYAEAYSNLGYSLQVKGELHDSASCLQQAIAIKPDYAEAYSNLGTTFHKQGKFNKAVQSYRKAIAIKPDFVDCRNQLICCLDHFVEITDNQPQIERKKWAEQHAKPLKVHWPSHKNSPDPERKLRIGYVGADFKNHSAALIFAPMLLNYDKDCFQLFCYAGNSTTDDLTLRFKENSTHWLQTSKMDDETLAKEITNDGIDILVDLAGHTLGNRLMVFARKPAPIQLTAWGYPLGTAMEAMDYLIADKIVIPLPERSKYTEQILDLSCIIQYSPTIEFPEITELPFNKNGFITFGAFNRIEKYNSELYKTWAEILIRIPNAKLLFKTGTQEISKFENEVKNIFFKYGVEKDRLTVLGRTLTIDHLDTHNQVDIVLDPYPHNGGLTTLDSLRMGVPVLTCEKLTPFPDSASVIRLLGLGEWCASSKADYIEKAVEFSQAISTLESLRRELRERYDNSVIGNSQLYVKEVEDSYRKIWKKWCDEQ